MTNATLRLLLSAVVVLLAACGQRPDLVRARQPDAVPAAVVPSAAPALLNSAVAKAADQKKARPVPEPTPTTVTQPSPEPRVAQHSEKKDAVVDERGDRRSRKGGDRAAQDARTERPAPDVTTADPAQRLWDRSFASVRVTENGQQKPLVEDSRLLVDPYKDPRQAVRFNGGCNTGGASVRITDERFLFGDDGGSSAAHCGNERMDQEQWLVDFMYSDPAWALSRDGRHLRLTSGATVIVFEEHPWPPPWEPYRSPAAPG